MYYGVGVFGAGAGKEQKNCSRAKERTLCRWSKPTKNVPTETYTRFRHRNLLNAYSLDKSWLMVEAESNHYLRVIRTCSSAEMCGSM